MPIIMIHRTGLDLPDASAEFACRVMQEATGKKYFQGNHGMLIKVPEKEGDSELVRNFFKKYPKFVPNYSRIPSEVEAQEYIKSDLGGVSKLGWGFLTHVLDANRVKYDVIPKDSFRFYRIFIYLKMYG